MIPCANCCGELPEDDDAVWHANSRWYCSLECAKPNSKPVSTVIRRHEAFDQ